MTEKTSKNKGDLAKVRKLYREKGLDAVWVWANSGSDCRRAHRFSVCAIFARKKRNAAKTPEKKEIWEKRRKVYHKNAQKYEKKCSGIKIIPREDWGAKSSRSQSNMTSTANGMFVHHTVTGDGGGTLAGEKAEMRNIQQIAFSRGFADISYSWVIFKSGRIYEGRGKGIVGAHTQGYNSTAYGVAAAGNYEISTPTKAMILSYRRLRRDYLKLGSKPLRPHSAVSQTACPGKNLRSRLTDM